MQPLTHALDRAVQVLAEGDAANPGAGGQGSLGAALEVEPDDHLLVLGGEFIQALANVIADARRHRAFVEYGFVHWDFIGQLETVLRSGRGIDAHDHLTPDQWNGYQRAMLENTAGFAWFVVGSTPVPRGATSCRDVSGSHGCIGGMLCVRHPPMRSTVLDRPQALATARDLGRGRPWHALIRFTPGDLLGDDWGTGHNVVLLANILHHFPAETNLAILRRAHVALRPGGVVSIFDIETPAEGAPPEAGSDGFALLFRIMSTARCIRAGHHAGWLAQAGFSGIRTRRTARIRS